METTVRAMTSDELLGGGIGIGLSLFMLALYAVFVAFAVYVHVRIARKAGYSGWWVLATFVPVLNLVVIIVFAFQEWPVEQRARAAEARLQAALTGTPYGASRFGQVGQVGQGQGGTVWS